MFLLCFDKRFEATQQEGMETLHVHILQKNVASVCNRTVQCDLTLTSPDRLLRDKPSSKCWFCYKEIINNICIFNHRQPSAYQCLKIHPYSFWSRFSPYLLLLFITTIVNLVYWAGKCNSLDGTNKYVSHCVVRVFDVHNLDFNAHWFVRTRSYHDTPCIYYLRGP